MMPEDAGNGAPAPQAAAGGNASLILGMVDKLYGFLPPDGDGCLGGGQLMGVMKKSLPPLSNQVLGGIWAASDTHKSGKLDKNQLVQLFGLMTLAQQGQAPDPALLTPDIAPPTIEGLEVPTGGAAPAAEVAPSGPQPFEANVPINTMADKLFGMFRQGPDGNLQAGQLKPVMEQSKPPLSAQVLGGIWQLCDGGKKGYLALEEVKRMFGLMSLAQVGGAPSVGALTGDTPAPTITGLN